MTRIVIDPKLSYKLANQVFPNDTYMWEDTDCKAHPMNVSMTAMTGTLEAYYQAHGFWYDRKTDELHCNLEHLPLIMRINEGISDEYDNEYDPKFDDITEGETLWSFFELGGDDDVDYCSSYVAIAIDVMIEYCEQNNIEIVKTIGSEV